MIRRKEPQEKVFTTLDAYLSGYLTLQGFIPRLIEQGNKVVFAFTASDELYQTIAEYNTGARVEASQLALATKTLKSQIHSLRRGKENRNVWIQEKNT
jgi:hypothetical protein